MASFIFQLILTFSGKNDDFHLTHAQPQTSPILRLTNIMLVKHNTYKPLKKQLKTFMRLE